MRITKIMVNLYFPKLPNSHNAQKLDLVELFKETTQCLM